MTGTKRRHVTNEEFERAYFGYDEASKAAARDNRNVIKAVTKRFSKQLSKDVLRTCGLHAMWKALGYHQDTFGQKFTTSLHRFAKWECLRELRREQTSRARYASLPDDYEEVKSEGSFEDLGHLDDYIDRLPYQWMRRVVRQHFLYDLSLRQIAKKNGWSYEASRQRLAQAVDALKNSGVLSKRENELEV